MNICNPSLNRAPKAKISTPENVDDTLVEFLDSMVRVYEQWKLDVAFNKRPESFSEPNAMGAKPYSEGNWCFTL